jgi:hypothetical protein
MCLTPVAALEIRSLYTEVQRRSQRVIRKQARRQARKDARKVRR